MAQSFILSNFFHKTPGEFKFGHNIGRVEIYENKFWQRRNACLRNIMTEWPRQNACLREANNRLNIYKHLNIELLK